MAWGYLWTVAIFFGILMIIGQRIVRRHQRMYYGFVVSMAVLLMIRYEQHLENIIGYGIALVIGFLFWLLIGRYNPIGDDDNEGIKVYGLDD